MTAKITSIDGIYRRMHSNTGVFFGLMHTRDFIDSFPVNIDPDYQRGHVWTEVQQRRFVGHIIEGGQVPFCVFNSGPRGDWDVAELVDGKQRVTAAMRWTDGEIAAELWDGREVWAPDLDTVSRRRLGLSVGMQYVDVKATRRECLELYIRLNRGGTVHSDQEIDRVKALLAAEGDR